MAEATIDGITISYADSGTGRPLVLVHGHPFDRSMWAPQVAEFAGAGWRLIAPDLRGYGASEVVAGVVELEVFARDIFALLDHLGVREVVLGGLSMGGQIVMECHRLFADRIRGLILADTFPNAETEAGKASRNATADRLLRDGMDWYAAESLPKMIADYNVEAMPAVAAHVQAMMTGTSPVGAAAALRGRALRRDYRQLLTEISVPTLVVVGRDDVFTPVGDARDMQERIPGSELVVVDGAGHLPNLEQPDTFNAALRAFLTRLR